MDKKSSQSIREVRSLGGKRRRESIEKPNSSPLVPKNHFASMTVNQDDNVSTNLPKRNRSPDDREVKQF
jgi:hypothetical protein